MKQVQIGDEEIRRMVTTFYTTVRQDDLLGHIFEHRFQGQWAPHLDRMCDFWSEVLNASGRYHDNPRQAHAGLKINPVAGPPRTTDSNTLRILFARS